jgi:DNA processing protein
MKPWRKWPIKVVHKKDEFYPPRLKRIKDSPEKLYYRGDWDYKIFAKAIAVVGSRSMTKYGEVAVAKLVPGLVRAGYTIVSGFMYGVDTAAHKMCLQEKGKTVAVLGGGLNQLTPSANDYLYSQVLNEGGIVMSEYEPEEVAKLWTFPQRNRIVAGLSQAVLVIEGGEKSGSLITAKLGFDQKKPVLAVPGPVTSTQSMGTNWLIRNGAVLVSSAADVLEELGEEIEVRPKQLPLDLTDTERQILEELEKEALSVDELSRKLTTDVVIVGQYLSELALRGLVEEVGDKYVLGS